MASTNWATAWSGFRSRIYAAISAGIQFSSLEDITTGYRIVIYTPNYLQSFHAGVTQVVVFLRLVALFNCN